MLTGPCVHLKWPLISSERKRIILKSTSTPPDKWHCEFHYDRGGSRILQLGGGGFCTGGGGRCMLNHLWCAVGPLHSQEILNFGVSWGGGGLKPPEPAPPLDPPLYGACSHPLTCVVGKDVHM